MRRIPFTPFAADYWSSQQGLTMYFLSHLHADHTMGLSDSWDLGIIYCSPISAALLRLKFPGLSEELIRPLEVGTTHLIPLDGPNQKHHMSVMFLWQGYFGTILYTGDFRYIPSLIDGSPLAEANVDVIYLDNTYLNPMFDFHSQADALYRLITKIEQLPDYREYTVIVGVDTLGKERLLIDLARHFGTVVDCDPARYAIIRAVDLQDGFSTVDGEVLLDVLKLFRCCEHFDNPPPYSRPSKGPRIVLTQKKGIGRVCGIVQRHQESTAGTSRILGAICTGWVFNQNHQQQGLTHRSKRRADYADVVKVPYSIHSNYSEIMEFIRRIKPARVFPIAGGGQTVSLDHLLSDGSAQHARVLSAPKEVTQYHLQLQRRKDPAFALGSSRRRQGVRKRPRVFVSEAESRRIQEETRARLQSIETMSEERVEDMIVQCVAYHNSKSRTPIAK